MSSRSMFLLLCIVFIEKSIGSDIRSVTMSVMKDQQFQCVNSTCLPFLRSTVSTVRECQLACLANDRCQAATFHESTSSCELFDNAVDPNGNMLSQTNVISMSVISGTRTPSVTTNASLNPCSNGIYWNVNGSIVAGTGIPGSSLNQLNQARGTYLYANSNLYISDGNNYRVMKYILNTSNISIVAGITGSYGSGLNQFDWPSYLYVDSSQNLYVSDYNNNRVVRWASGASSGSIVAGNGTPGSSSSQLNQPMGIWVDSSSNIFVADNLNHRVVRWALNASSGVVVAGVTNSSGITTDKLYRPEGLFYDEMNQDLYISNNYGHTIMRWHVGDSNGTVIAGVPGISGSTTTLLRRPTGILLDQWKNLYVSDYRIGRVQLFCYGNTTAITIAGSGTGGNNLTGPVSIQLDSQMNLYVSELAGHCVTKFDKL